MMRTLGLSTALCALLLSAVLTRGAYADSARRGDEGGDGGIRHVLLISIDGMHATDFANCTTGISGANHGDPYCPNLAKLSEHGVTYTSASTSKPSDSFPGLLSMVTGGSPRSVGVFYDVSYDRGLSPPAKTTPGDIPGGASLCPGQRGTPVGYDEFIDVDHLKLDGGGGIDPNFLPRDPNNGCAPVYPHQFLRVNTIFEVVNGAGGYTAWADKHPAYEIVNGPSGTGVDDLYTPEINSLVVPLKGIPGCDPVPDPSATDAWTSSLQNIQCYDTLKVRAILNQIDGRTHDGAKRAPVPRVFGMNFQAVSVGQKLPAGGYLDALGTPTDGLLGEITFVDAAIGQMVARLKKHGRFESTLIIVTAKHGQSPIDPHQLLRIPADNPADKSRSTILGPLVAASIEDDVSLLWLTDQSKPANAVAQLAANTAIAGIDTILSGAALTQLFNDPLHGSRTPDIIVVTKVGVVYTGHKAKIAEHGGFAHNDTNVILLVAHPGLEEATNSTPVETTQIAPTILKALSLEPDRLQAVKAEGTQPLPGLRLGADD